VEVVRAEEETVEVKVGAVMAAEVSEVD